MPLAWFFKKVVQVWLDECAFLSFGMYFWMLRLLTSIPSFNNSPRIRSAPHKRFSFAIFWIKMIVSDSTFGLPCDFRRQDMRNKFWCQRRRVSGWRIWRACFQNVVKWARRTRWIRSAWVSRGRLTCRFRMISCWRNNAFSTTRSARLRVKSESMPTAKDEVTGFVQSLMRSCSQTSNLPILLLPGYYER